MHGLGARSGVPVAAALLLAACSGSSTPASTMADGGGATSAPGVTAQSGGGGNGSVTGMKACSLLSTAEIQAALGSAMKDGVEQDTDNQVDCEWDSQADGGPSMGLIVKTYDDTLWQTMSSSQLATPISGFGDAAYTGYPHKGDIAIKVKGNEVDLGIVDFQDPQSKIDAADQSLAKLVLSRL